MALAIGATREGTDFAKIAALFVDDGHSVVFPVDTTPANATQAARELLGDEATFSHLASRVGGYPVYRDR